MSTLVEKLFSAGDGRKTRLHDRLGNRVSVGTLIYSGSRAIATFLLLKVFKFRPAVPWLSFDARKRLEAKLASAPCSVLEFGSGMSTIWFAKRANVVVSIEHDPSWFADVQRLLADVSRGATLEYELRPTNDEYVKARAAAREAFDIVLVDGRWRAETLENHLRAAKPNGMIYLDNADAESSCETPGEMAEARRILEGFASEKGVPVQRFVDFAPGCLFATQGLLVDLDSR